MTINSTPVTPAPRAASTKATSGAPILAKRRAMKKLYAAKMAAAARRSRTCSATTAVAINTNNSQNSSSPTILPRSFLAVWFHARLRPFARPDVQTRAKRGGQDRMRGGRVRQADKQ